MSRRRSYLLLGLVVASVTLILTLLDAPLWLRAPFGLSVVALIPGYALLEILDPDGRIGIAERLTLASACSIALTLLTGLLLAASPAGLRTLTWTATLCGLSVTTTLLALRTARERPPDRARTVVLTRQRLGSLGETGAVFILMTALALALAAAAATVPLGSERGVEEGRASRLQLWAVPVEGTAMESIDVGVENPTAVPIVGTLIVRQGPVTIDRRDLLLAPNDLVTMNVQPAQNASIMFPVEVLLIGSKGDETLRRVFVWPGATDRQTDQAVNSEG